MKPNPVEVGARIRDIRISNGLTLDDFGWKIGDAHRSSVSKWELGITLPNKNRIREIAELAGISTKELLYGKEAQEGLSNFTTEQLLDEIRRRLSQ